MLLFRSSLSGGTANYDDFGTNVMGNFIYPEEISASPTRWVLLYNHIDPNNFNEPVTIGKYITNCSYLFANLPSFNQPVNIPSRAFELIGMFGGSGFNCPIELPFCNEFPPGLDPSGYADFVVPVTVNLTGMFMNSAFNQPINNFPSYFDGTSMFANDSVFNQPVNFFNSTSYNFADMFLGCSNFNQPIEFYNILSNDDHNNGSIHYSLSYMFARCSNFNSPVIFNNYLGSSDFSGAYDFDVMFYKSAFNCPIDFSNITTTFPLSFSGTFKNTPFNQPIIFPYVNRSIFIYETFYRSPFNQPINIDGEEWAELITLGNPIISYDFFDQPVNISPNLISTDFSNGFSSCGELNSPINLPTFILEDYGVSDEICYISNLFRNCYNFNQPLIFNFQLWNSGNATVFMNNVMDNCNNFNESINFNIDFNDDDYINIDASYFFYGCTNFNPTLDTFEEGEAFLPKWITIATGMFKDCNNFNVNHISIPRDAVNCYRMFFGCNHINHLHIYKENSFDFGNFCLAGLLANTEYNSRCEILIDENSSPKTYNAIIGSNIFYERVQLSWINESWGSYNTYYNLYVIQNYNDYINWTP